MTSARTRQKTRGPFRSTPGALSSSDTKAGEQVPVLFMRRSRYNILGDWSANRKLAINGLRGTESTFESGRRLPQGLNHNLNPPPLAFLPTSP